MNKKYILIIAAVIFVVLSAFIFYPDYESPRIVKFLIISQILFVLSIIIFLIGRNIDFETEHRRLFLIILFMALSARAVMLVGAGDKYYISDDIYRYIWDGKVNASGINPFLYEPPAPELKHLRDDYIYPKINHPYLPTIYPPLAQNIFYLSYITAGDSIWGFKALSVIFELLTVIMLIYWLKIAGFSRANILLYLFSPLILIEFYLSSHLDILAMPFFVGSLIAIHQRRPVITGLMLALAALVKFFALFFVPVLFFYFKKKDKIYFTGTFLIILILSYLPYVLGSDGRFLGSLMDYLETWQFNASIFNVLKYELDFEHARIAVALLFIVWIIFLICRKMNIVRKLFNVFGGYLVLTTTFFPWYFVWMYPFILRNLSPAFIFLSGSVLLSYHVHIGYYETGAWSVMPWLGVLAYLPFYILLVLPPLMRMFKK